MSEEGQLLEKKSLRLVMGKTTDWQELAKDCVAFANATGGNLLLGIEDGEDMPPAGQQIPPDLPDKLRRRISECTVNVDVWPDIRTSSNGGQYINLHVRRSSTTSSTTDGRFYLRVGDQSKPVTGDGVMRLVTERGTKP